MTPDRRRQQSGFVLLAAMAVLACAALFVNVLLSRSMIERLAAQRYVVKQQAFHVAEAGLDEVFFELRKPSNSFPASDQWTPITIGDVGDPLYAQCAAIGFPCYQKLEGNLVTGSVQILVGSVGSNFLTVRLRAQAGGVSEALNIEAGLSVSPPATSPWTLLGTTTSGTGLRLSNAMRIDSWDSRLGAYGTILGSGKFNQSNSGDASTWNAHIRTNSVEILAGQEAIMINNGLQGADFPAVWGDATVGPGLTGDPMQAIFNPAPIRKSPSSYSSPVLNVPSVELPAGGPCPTCGQLNFACGETRTVAQLNSTFSSIVGTQSGSDYAAPCALRITGSGVVQLSELKLLGTKSSIDLDGAQITLVVHGPVQLGEWNQVNMFNGATVKIYADGNVTMGAYSHVNVPPDEGMPLYSNGTPSQFLLYVKGASHSVNLGAGLTFYGLVYAPESVVELGTDPQHIQTHIYGSVIGNQILVGKYPSTSGLPDVVNVHYDQALTPPGGSSGGFLLPINLRLWRYRDQ